jgi:hypothetical protein
MLESGRYPPYDAWIIVRQSSLVLLWIDNSALAEHPRRANHSTNSFVFSTEAALCEGRFCSSSSGTRLIGSCMIGRARLVWRRTCRRDSSSSSGGPKTRRTIIANTNHPLIVSLYRVVQKSPHDRAGIGSSQRIGCVIRRIRVPDGSSYSTRSKLLWLLVKYCRSQLVPKCDWATLTQGKSDIVHRGFPLTCTIAPVPEPSTWAMMLLGLCCSSRCWLERCR